MISSFLISALMLVHMMKHDGEMVHEILRTLSLSVTFLFVTQRKYIKSFVIHEPCHHLASACDLTLMQRLKKMKSFGWKEMKPYGWREMKPTKNIGDFFPFCIHCHCR
jgi:hypothetical protein